MSLLLQYLPEINHFYQLETHKQDQLVAKILSVSQDTEKAQFLNELTSLTRQEVVVWDPIFEALSKNFPKWEDFFLSEYTRRITLIKNGSEDDELLSELGFTVPTEDRTPSKEFLNSILALLLPLCTHLNFSVAYQAHMLADDWSDFDLAYSQKYENLLATLLTDQNWKVRHLAYSLLTYRNSLPKNFRRSFSDRLRTRLFKVFKGYDAFGP
ncbi:MAG: hypothetical protein JJ975_09270 [Bacteroidia bacterium]|nr:hypothetical protein [Bacteroidia bacterium]